jgi:ribosome biogenesis protein ERB1
MYADYDWPEFSADKRIEVLGNAQEPKRRFIPSKWEAKKIIKLVHSIRNGWLKLEKEEEPEEVRAL